MDDGYRTEGRGRSAKKREAKEVEHLAERLVTLPESELPGLPLTGPLRDELMQARQTRGHSSRKRQIKHFAGLLRRDDDAREAVRKALEETESKHARSTAEHHDLEQLRERLCAKGSRDQALQEVSGRFPSIDLDALRRLIGAVENTNDKKAFREIFRRLRDAQT